MFYNEEQDRQMNPSAVSENFAAEVLKAVQGEATAIDFYGRLAEAAPSEDMKSAILGIRQDEQDHFQLFSWLYIRLTGTQPAFQVTPVRFQSFSEGLRIAYHDELKDYETYRNLYLMTQDPTIRNILLRAFTDEIKHAIRFGLMTTSLS
ncbi:ferritin-like domain-containing protein [Sporolactobacillus sp. CPB3-1]|uniref:Ferritin-like domain-containing protein n=1 Tax=Sporolactobacillus mangiferae TaxID=2940498 RepID=A0ABT0M9Y4_9BACL|nr:ferritin-like domain-containing protein [Sporolactobacillus mangiferae]MCL1631672.1 ferritin-like domain-containing protein [Sporolactobacillus mangiferae]